MYDRPLREGYYASAVRPTSVPTASLGQVWSPKQAPDALGSHGHLSCGLENQTWPSHLPAQGAVSGCAGRLWRNHLHQQEALVASLAPPLNPGWPHGQGSSRAARWRLTGRSTCCPSAHTAGRAPASGSGRRRAQVSACDAAGRRSFSSSSRWTCPPQGRRQAW